MSNQDQFSDNSESQLIENSAQKKSKIETECEEIDRISDTCCFEIVAPYVEHLTISGVFNDTRIKLRDFSSLNHANLDLNCDEFDEMDENIVKDLLVSARCADELILSSWFVKRKTSPYHCGNADVDNKFLYFKTFVPPTRQPPKYHPFYEDEDIDLSKDKKYLSIEENIFKVSLQNLKNVKVMPLCSHTYTSDATELHQFLKFLLEHAINLEKLVIVPEHNDCNNSSTNTSNLMKYLLPFPTSAIISLGPVSQNVFYSKFV
ncbi:hypothetical protein MTR67_017633 [Solanum verrucosum]|uniref:FBD domain-containing protein n=1 Tax=Solanum verrucosum TaxID=315347 RepID=A0AAF0TS05_SOLVR|nr:hypothetical protein MTR67_017633 [Solanum verrucosum]